MFPHSPVPVISPRNQPRWGARGSVLVEALCYKPEVLGLTPDEVKEFFFSIYLSISAALSPGVHSSYNRNEYQKQKNNVSV
jgi:hypothetical protein